MLNSYFEAVVYRIQKCHMESRRLFDKEPNMIHVPYTKQQVDWLFQISDSWENAFAQFSERIGNHIPAHRLLQFALTHPFVFPKS